MPGCVVMQLPALDDDLAFPQRVEDLAVEKFVLEPGVEGLDDVVLPGAARGRCRRSSRQRL